MFNKLLLTATTLVTCSSASATTVLAAQNNNRTTTQAIDITANDDLNFNNAYRDAKIGFAHLVPQYQHAKKYSEQSDAWQGPQFSVYWGRDYNQPFNGPQIIKDSPVSNFTLAFLNPLSNEDESSNLGAGYIDSFQEIHALGGNVTVSFGGWTPSETSFFNIDASAAIMYEHLRELAIGYNVNSFDFDIESSHSFYGNDAIACSMALAKLHTLLTSLHRTMQGRFTESYIDTDTINTVAKYYGTDFIWNDMQWTQATANSSNSYVEDELTHDMQTLKSTPAFSKMTDQEAFHHIGCTSALKPALSGQYGKLSYNDFKNLIPWALKNQLGFIGLWNVGLDHMTNSPLNHEEAGSGVVSDFYFSKLIQNNYGNIANWDPNKYHQKPTTPTNVRLYAKSKQYITLKWDAVANAQYYILEDDKGNVIQKVKRTLASLSLREYPKLQVVGNHAFKVIAVNPKGESAPTKAITVNIAKNLIAGQIEYYDANVNYYNLTWEGQSTPTPAVKYIYFQGKIYEDINHTQAGIAMDHSPATDTTDWKLIGTATNKTFGLTANRIQDLKNFEWDQNINKKYPLVYVNFTNGQDTLPLIPKFNKF